jgi:hypothetical protein
VDTEGARALAERIAAGPPQEGDAPEPGRQPEPAPKKAASSVEIVYFTPRPVMRRDVRIYVRGSDGRLVRSDQ